MRIELPTPKDMLSLKPMTSPLKKKIMTIFGSLINDSKEDEEWACLDEIGGRVGGELDATIM